MELIPVQCSHCGAGVEVDSYSKSFICSVCGGTTFIEKNNNTFSDTYHDESIRNAELLIENQTNYIEAKNKFDYMTKSYPDDPRPWLGLIRCYTRDLSIKLYIDVSPYEPIWLDGLEARLMEAYNNYIRVETKEQQKSYTSQVFNEYIMNNKKEYEELIKKNKPLDSTNYSISSNTSETSFNETIKAENKIIKSDDILNVVKKMIEAFNKYQFVYQKEKEVNTYFDFNEHEYTFKDNGSKIKFTVNFHDNTSVNTDDIDEFYYIYENRLSEIQNIDVSFYLNYNIEKPKPNKVDEYISQSINLYIREDRLSIDVKLNSKDDKISDLYGYVKQIVLTAPVKYDDIIKNRTSITLISGLAIGLIPSMLITLILYFMIESLQILFGQSYILFPILNIIIGFVIGGTISFMIFNRLYANIKPEQKYAGYKDGQSIYTDNVEDFVNKSEILIGKNVNNMNDRESISKTYNKCKKMLLVELVILLLLSITVVVYYSMMQ